MPTKAMLMGKTPMARFENPLRSCLRKLTMA